MSAIGARNLEKSDKLQRPGTQAEMELPVGPVSEGGNRRA